MSVPIWCFAVARYHVPKDKGGHQDEDLIARIALTIWAASLRQVLGDHE